MTCTEPSRPRRPVTRPEGCRGHRPAPTWTMVATVAVLLAGGVAAGCANRSQVAAGTTTDTLCVEEQPSPVTPIAGPLPDALKDATWRQFYSALSDTDIARYSNLTREQLDIQANLQADADVLLPWLTRRYPNEIGLKWLDPASGSIVITTTSPDQMRTDPELALYPRRSYVTIAQARWSELRLDATLACLARRTSKVPANAQLRFYKAAGEAGISAADNEAGRAALASPTISEEVAMSDGALTTKLHPVEIAKTDG
jgi:hypothetical protein